MKTTLPCILFFCCLLLSSATQSSSATPSASVAQFALEKSEKGYKILIDGRLFTEYITDQNGTPILWPLIGPGGQRMTRDYPMIADKPDEKKDHPHHRSLWFTHGDVNGVDFWAVGPGKGKIRHDRFALARCDGDTATLQSENSWVTPKDDILCTDRRTVTFSEKDGARIIEYQIELTAAVEECRFGDTKEGTFGVRVAGSMDVDAKNGGKIVNAQGEEDDAAWGKRSEWVEYSGPVDPGNGTIKIFDTPGGFRYPTYWHVRTYGLFAANPFGEHDFQNKPEKTGDYVLKKGETIRFKYIIQMRNEK